MRWMVALDFERERWKGFGRLGVEAKEGGGDGMAELSREGVEEREDEWDMVMFDEEAQR